MFFKDAVQNSASVLGALGSVDIHVTLRVLRRWLLRLEDFFGVLRSAVDLFEEGHNRVPRSFRGWNIDGVFSSLQTTPF